MKHILMVLTSHSAMENTDSTTGVWLGEFTDPYYEFIDAGYQVTICQPFRRKTAAGSAEFTNRKHNCL
ncbi:hypothetical protein KRR40_04975 [Niabella defluvii]|nr:hypothetical protein KRR40_04975 [Niabella sp. I65]